MQHEVTCFKPSIRSILVQKAGHWCFGFFVKSPTPDFKVFKIRLRASDTNFKKSQTKYFFLIQKI